MLVLHTQLARATWIVFVRMASLLSIFMLFVQTARADSLTEIKKAYARSTEATELKYLDGVYCIRAPGFQLYNQEGMRLDLNVERARWAQVLQPAYRVSEKLEILSHERVDQTHAKCKVRYTTELVSVSPFTEQEISQIITTVCSDDWALTPKGWRITTTRVIEQGYQK